MTPARALARIDQDFPAHVRAIQDFLRISSTAGNRASLKAAAAWLSARLRSLGANVEYWGPADSPVILARLDVGAKRTLLVYGMYDVHGVRGQKWSSPPFAANVLDLADIGPAVVARGACNSKGPFAAFLNAVRAITETGTLPVNLIFLIEGEEESGSPSLPTLFAERREYFNADAGFEPFWAMYGTDVHEPVLSLGTKGIVNLLLTCRGGSWGGPTTHAMHSSVGAWIGSPVWRLLRALASMVDDREEILISKLTADAPPPSKSDEKLLRALSRRVDEKQTLALAGARRFKYDLHGADLLRAYLFSPTIHVTSFGPMGGDVIPPEVQAELLVRLVPGMEPKRAEARVRAHLQQGGFGDIEVARQVGYPGSRTSLSAPVVQALLRAYRELGQDPQIWPLLASATPYYLFSEVLGIPYVTGGLGRAGRSHAPDEYATIEGIRDFEKSIVSFLYHFAASDSSSGSPLSREA